MIQERIEKFVGYFQQQLNLAAQLSSHALTSDPDVALRLAMHRKILYCVMLDCLAGVRYHGEESKVGRRFIRLLQEHTSWPDGHLVSVPILHERLDKAAPASLRSRLQARLNSGDPNAGTGEPLSAFDEPMQDLLFLAGKGEATRMQVEKAQHFHLVYSYRNFVVHEFREPGYSMEFFGEGERDPLYHSYANDSTWRLLYPADFFHRLAEEALASLHTWLTQNSVDPYKAVPDSSGW